MLKALYMHAHQDLRELHPEYSKFLSTAVINQQFRELLISDSGRAVSTGFFGEPFKLTTKEKLDILSLKSLTLSDFATRLALL